MDARVKMGMSALLLGLGLGFAGGRGLAPAVGDGELRQALQAQREQLDALPGLIHAAIQPGRCAVAAASPVEPLVLRREISQAVREALSEASEGGAGAVVPPAEPKPAEPSQESLAARDEGLRLIDLALNARQWGAAEETQLSSLLARMEGPQQEEVLRTLTTRMNSGALDVTVP